MLKLTTVVSVVTALLLLIGCDVMENPITPVTGEPENTLNFIKLPDPGTLSKPVTASVIITPQTGGELSVTYKQGQGKEQVDIDISLRFEPGSVSENTEITMTVDEDVLRTNIDITFGPSGTSFLKPGSLNVRARNLDLSELPSNARIRLYYENGDEWEEIGAKMIRHNVDTGQIQCVDGEIPHFSRYAFAF